jgi:1,4-dihydroxy-2-naphthoate octaprenyltransferase
MIVLSILPVTFVAYAFTSTLDWAFWLFLAGQALTVYGVIVPAEIRDYFSDKATGTVTMTVQLGLVKASLLGLALLSVGGTLCATGFILKLSTTSLPFLSVFLVIMGAAYFFVLSKYWKLLNLSKQLNNSLKQPLVEQEIVALAARNPKWITIVTQTIVLMSLILLIAKII